MSGHVGDLSPEQEESLKEFKKRCADVWEDKFDDYFALKWLRARKFVLDKAELMLRNHLKYRKKIDLDNIVKNYQMPEVLQKYASGGVCGHDQNGCPLWIVPAGGYDAIGLANSLTLHELALYTMYLTEKCNELAKENSEKLGKRVDTRVFLVDLENFSMKQIMSKLVRRIIGRSVFLYESNYPESLARAYIINAPSFFPFCWKILRPLLSDDTAEKIQIFGKDGWQAAFFEQIDRDQVPKHYGGTLVGPTGCPRCTEMVPIGGIIPEKYYIKNMALQGPNVKTVLVPKRSSYEIELYAKMAGHVINWVFRTNGHDLSYAIYYKEDDDSTKNLIPLTRVDCHQVPEEGFYSCAREGKYIFKLDNSFSWFTDKTAVYDISIGPPADSFQMHSNEPLKEASLSQRA